MLLISDQSTEVIKLVSKGVTLTIGVPDGWRRANSTAAAAADGAAATYEMVLDVGANDTALNVSFLRA